MPKSRQWLLLACAVAVGILLTGWTHFQVQQNQALSELQRLLSADLNRRSVSELSLVETKSLLETYRRRLSPEGELLVNQLPIVERELLVLLSARAGDYHQTAAELRRWDQDENPVHTQTFVAELAFWTGDQATLKQELPTLCATNPSSELCLASLEMLKRPLVAWALLSQSLDCNASALQQHYCTERLISAQKLLIESVKMRTKIDWLLEDQLSDPRLVVSPRQTRPNELTKHNQRLAELQKTSEQQLRQAVLSTDGRFQAELLSRLIDRTARAPTADATMALVGLADDELGI